MILVHLVRILEGIGNGNVIYNIYTIYDFCNYNRNHCKGNRSIRIEILIYACIDRELLTLIIQISQ